MQSCSHKYHSCLSLNSVTVFLSSRVVGLGLNVVSVLVLCSIVVVFRFWVIYITRLSSGYTVNTNISVV